MRPLVRMGGLQQAAAPLHVGIRQAQQVLQFTQPHQEFLEGVANAAADYIQKTFKELK